MTRKLQQADLGADLKLEWKGGSPNGKERLGDWEETGTKLLMGKRVSRVKQLCLWVFPGWVCKPSFVIPLQLVNI